MPGITFSEHDVTSPITDSKLIQKWLTHIAEHYQHSIQELSYIFCNDAYLHRLNKKYLNHDTLTDIITFDLKEKKETNTIVGEIYISLERVKENAAIFQVTFKQETLRVIVHGLLHLLGYHDQTQEEKEKMRRLENKWLSYFSSFFAI